MTEQHIHHGDAMTHEKKTDYEIMMHFIFALQNAQSVVHRRNKKWWVSLETGEPIQRNFGEICMLIVSEISEAMEGHRKNLMDDKITNRHMAEVEFADALIRIMDACEGFGFDLAGAWYEKMQYNHTRIDHTLEHRKSEHGKKY